MPGKSRALQELEEAHASLVAPDVNDGTPQYRPIFAAQAYRFALLGLTREEMADAINVDVSTFQRWLAEKPALRLAIQRGGKHADGQVARALYRRATGMMVRKEKVASVDGQPQVVEIKEELPPDVTAASMWLANRDRKRWRAASAGDSAPTLDLGSLIDQLEARRQGRAGDDAKAIEPLDMVTAP